jgi:tRNA(Ile)-lysidine synthase
MNPKMDIIPQVKRTLSRYRMIESGDTLIVAVSGGPDSVCLLDILNRIKGDFNLTLVVAHFNHGLRPAEDPEETRFVHGLAQAMNLPCDTGHGASLLEAKPGSPEERAREARYAFLETVKERHGAGKIALGHNLNDQVETIIMRLLRGSGLKGLAGIPPVRDGVIIRPLIEISRSDINRYLDHRGLRFVTDSSNLNTEYLRNRIRLELLPLLLEYQPRLLDRLGRLSDILREEDEYLEREARECVDNMTWVGPDGEGLVRASDFRELPGPLRNRVVRILLKKFGGGLRRITNRHIQTICDLAMSSRPQTMVNLPLGLTVKRRYDDMVFMRGEEHRADGYLYTLYGPGTLHLAAIERSLILEEIEPVPDRFFDASPNTEWLDAEKIHFPVRVRNFRPGDRFIPLGMTGHRKIKDFFIDQKIPREGRRLTPILFVGETPAWICGLRLDDRFKVTEKTQKIMKATLL